MNPTFFLHPDDGDGKQEERGDTQQSVGEQSYLFQCFRSWEKSQTCSVPHKQDGCSLPREDKQQAQVFFVKN